MRKVLVLLLVTLVFTLTACTSPESDVPNLPEIKLNGSQYIYLPQGEDYIEELAYATDSNGQALVIDVVYMRNNIVVESLDSDIEGVYTIVYSAMDSGKNYVSVHRIVTVVQEEQVLTRIETKYPEVSFPANLDDASWLGYLNGYDQYDNPMEVRLDAIEVEDHVNMLTPGTYYVDFHIIGMAISTYSSQQLKVVVNGYDNDYEYKGAGYGYNFLQYSSSYFDKEGINWSSPIVNLGSAQAAQKISTNVCYEGAELTGMCGGTSITKSIFTDSEFALARELNAHLSAGIQAFRYQVGVEVGVDYSSESESQHSYWQHVSYMNTNSVVLKLEENYSSYVTNEFLLDFIELNRAITYNHTMEVSYDNLSSSQKALLVAFLNKYGTHLILNAAHGGVLTLSREFNSSFEETALALGMSATVEAGFGNAKVSTGLEMTQAFTNESDQVKIETIGGDSVQFYNEDQIINWAQSVQQGNTDIIGINKLEAVWNLLVDYNYEVDSNDEIESHDLNYLNSLLEDYWYEMSTEINTEILDQENDRILHSAIKALTITPQENLLNEDYILPLDVEGYPSIDIAWWSLDEEGELDDTIDRVTVIHLEDLEGVPLIVRGIFTYLSEDNTYTSREVDYSFSIGNKFSMSSGVLIPYIPEQVDIPTNTVSPGQVIEVQFLYDNEVMYDLSNIALYGEIDVDCPIDLLISSENTYDDYLDLVYVDDTGNLVIEDYAPNGMILNVNIKNGSQSLWYQFIIDNGTELYDGFMGGNGSENYPYMIESHDQWLNIEWKMDAYYELMVDLDLTGDVPMGYGNSFYMTFTGGLNGAGHKITMLSAPQHNYLQNDYYYSGVFAKVDGASIKNIELELNVLYPRIGGTQMVGGIAGESNNSSFYNILVHGTIGMNFSGDVAWSNHKYIGGIVGLDSGSSFERIHNQANISNYTRLYGHTGGVVGKATNSSFTHIYNEGDMYSYANVKDVTAYTYTGGIAGVLDGCSMNWVLNSGTTSFFGWGDYSWHKHTHYWGGLYGKDVNNTKLSIRNGYYVSDIDINPSGGIYWTGALHYAFDAKLVTWWDGSGDPTTEETIGIVAVQSSSYEVYVRQIETTDYNNNEEDGTFISTFPEEWEFDNGVVTCVDFE